MELFLKSVLVFLSFILAIGLQAQETITTTGGEASGVGSASYTVGQTVYTTQTGINGNTLAQGVQQPYEISVVTGLTEAIGINISVFAYPNPTSDYLIIKVEGYETENLQYQVFDINGKLLKSKKADGNETQIATTELAPATYFVKILDREKEIKVFKIIKN